MSNNFIFHKTMFISLLVNIVVENAKAQQNNLNRDNILTEFVFKGNHIQFNFSTLATIKAKLENVIGDHPVKAKTAPGFLLGFNYQINFNNYYSLMTGAEAIILGRNFISSFDKNDFSPPLDRDYIIDGKDSYLYETIIGIPILIEKRWLYSQKKYLLAKIGFQLNISTGADLNILSIILRNVNGGYYDVGGTFVYANNDAKPWLSFPLNAGHSWLLRNNNGIQLSICSNISFTKYVNGTYMIDVPGKPLTTGKYSSTGSYIGLSMNYIFTNANYRIRKAYEKMKNDDVKK